MTNIIGPQPMSIDDVAKRAGGIGKLAEVAGIRWSTVCGWKRTTRGLIPTHHVRRISEALGIPLHLIRPDLWSPEAETSHGAETSPKTEMSPETETSLETEISPKIENSDQNLVENGDKEAVRHELDQTASGDKEHHELNGAVRKLAANVLRIIGFGEPDDFQMKLVTCLEAFERFDRRGPLHKTREAMAVAPYFDRTTRSESFEEITRTSAANEVVRKALRSFGASREYSTLIDAIRMHQQAERRVEEAAGAEEAETEQAEAAEKAADAPARAKVRKSKRQKSRRAGRQPPGGLLPYLQRFDSNSTNYIYFRYRANPRVLMRGAEGSAEFVAAYEAAWVAAGLPRPRLKQLLRRYEAWRRRDRR
jgi:hypothetical protein